MSLKHHGFKSIVFDLDGTLIDSMPASYLAFRLGIQAIGGRSLSDTEMKPLLGAGETDCLIRMMDYLKISITDHKIQSAKKAFLASMNNAIPQLVLFDQVFETLAHLKNQKLSLSIFTGRSRGTTDAILKHHRLSGHFEKVVTSDDIKEPKPSAEGLVKLSRELSFEPSSVFFIGDSNMDSESARRAGVPFGAALWYSGHTLTQGDLDRPHVIRKFNSLSELAQIL